MYAKAQVYILYVCICVYISIVFLIYGVFQDAPICILEAF